jgi:propanol-preferring alcohol dehydrogenase
VARQRQRARDRKQRAREQASNPGTHPSELHRSNVPGSLDHSSAAEEEFDAAIVFAPVGSLVPTALRAVRKGGSVVCAGIHMTDIPAFPYELLWGERSVRSVANLTRADGHEFLELASRIPIRTDVEVFDLEDANEALDRLRAGRIRHSAVLRV